MLCGKLFSTSFLADQAHEKSISFLKNRLITCTFYLVHTVKGLSMNQNHTLYMYQSHIAIKFNTHVAA